MDVREKLIDLLYEAEGLVNNELPTVAMVADHLIAHGVTVQEKKRFLLKENGDLIPLDQEWISVKDRLPDLELVDAKANDLDVYPCLCVVKNQNAIGGRYVAKLFYDGENFVDRDRCIWTFKTTHWMPLPQPPKGE